MNALIDKTHIGCDDAPGPYYVTAEDGGRFAPLLGPYATHREALDNVERAKRAAWDLDPKAPWYAYGTCRYPADCTFHGKLNDRIGLAQPAEA